MVDAGEETPPPVVAGIEGVSGPTLRFAGFTENHDFVESPVSSTQPVAPW